MFKYRCKLERRQPREIRVSSPIQNGVRGRNIHQAKFEVVINKWVTGFILMAEDLMGTVSAWEIILETSREQCFLFSFLYIFPDLFQIDNIKKMAILTALQHILCRPLDKIFTSKACKITNGIFVCKKFHLNLRFYLFVCFLAGSHFFPNYIVGVLFSTSVSS